MAATVEEKYSLRNTKVTKDETTHAKGWLVYDTNLTDTAALTASGVSVGDDYGDSTYCNDIAVKIFSGDKLGGDVVAWIVTANYSSKAIDDPTNKPDEITWSSRHEQEEMLQDSAGKDVENSAGEPFDRQPTWDKAYPTCSYTMYLASFDPAQIETYVNTTNSAAVTLDGKSFGANECRMADIQCGQMEEENEITFRKVTYVIEINPDGWEDMVVLDTGYSEIVGGIRKPILNSEQVPVKKPWALDGAGVKKAVGAAPAEIKFDPYESVSWAGLSFS